MARPRHEQPTPAELQVLKVFWDREGPGTVRDVLEVVNRDTDPPRAYTSVMSLLNVMTDKGLLRRSPRGRAFLYEPVGATRADSPLAARRDTREGLQRFGQLAGGSPARPV